MVDTFPASSRSDFHAVGDELDEFRLWDASSLPPALRAGLPRERAHAQFPHEQIRGLERERQREITHGQGRPVDQVRLLLRLKVIGPSGPGCT